MNLLNSTIRYDFFAALVVFLVAIPLCLGIALASGAPLISGIISGIIGGCVVSFFSQSRFSVTGPAAGLALIVYNSIQQLGALDIFLVSVILAGIFQIFMSFLKLGNLSTYVPSSVIKGMLSGIGIILIFQQIPHLLGYEKLPLADETSFLSNPLLSLESFYLSILSFSKPVLIVSLSSLLILFAWNTEKIKKNSFLSLFPAPLICVAFGILYSYLSLIYFPDFALSAKQLVNVPSFSSFDQLAFPRFSALLNPDVYKIALTLAFIASLESLLSIDAIQKLDPAPRMISPNRELFAQGIGNICSGFIGGLPVSAVIVRSSANINAGAKTKNSSIIHGVFLFLSVLFIAPLLNLIPLASLAAILFVTGYKLTDIKLIRDIYSKGKSQFIPFSMTVSMIIFTDLLTGMMIGLVCGLIYILYYSQKSNLIMTGDGNNYLIKLNKDVSFLSKGKMKNYFQKIPDKSFVVIDGQKADSIDHDIMEMIKDFSHTASKREIQLSLKNIRS